MNKAKICFHNLEEGWFLVSALIMITLLSALGLSISALVAEQYQHTASEEYTQNAELVAEAGIEQTVYQLNASSSFSGYSTPQVFFNNSTQGQGSYTTTVTENSDGTSKTIIATGNIYRPNSTSTPYATRMVRVVVVGASSTGYAVYSGPGGLILGGAANITNSNVYVGGKISMSGAAQIGTYSNPVILNDAYDSCPNGPNPGPTYPIVCTSGQPISMTIPTVDIYGTVCATDQTTPPWNNILGGNGGAGLELGCIAPVSTPPTYNRMGQINAVTTTASGSSNSYVCNSFPFNRNWPGNLELTGNVTVNQTCNVTINGNVYITGNLTITDAAQINIANGVGTTPPVIIVDGTITFNGATSIIANSSGTGVEFISFDSANPCTTSTTSYCPTITGNDLYNSQTMNTINVAGASSLAGAAFDAYWSEVSITGAGRVGAAAGQTVNLVDAGTLVFGTNIVSGGSQTWTIASYQPFY
jgi:hypothetical protein